MSSKWLIIKFLLVLVYFSLPAICWSDCFDAFRKCRNECMTNGCEDSCQIGKSNCEDEEDLSEGCYAFKRKCKSECDYLSIKEQNLCEDACQAGYRKCE